MIRDKLPEEVHVIIVATLCRQVHGTADTLVRLDPPVSRSATVKITVASLSRTELEFRNQDGAPPCVISRRGSVDYFDGGVFNSHIPIII